MTKKTGSRNQAARETTRRRAPKTGQDGRRDLAAKPATRAGTAPAPSRAPAPPPLRTSASTSGDAIVAIARGHLGEPYVLGARAPLANADWHGPWDCAEFASWCVYQATGVLYGVRPENDPVLADAYTGYWGEQAERDGATVPVAEAVRIAGACLLRKPAADRGGHIAISTGDGGTLEAYSGQRGVIAHTAQRRRWDYGVLVPGIGYYLAEDEVKLEPPPARVLRITQPLTRGRHVERVQQQLQALGYAPGRADGIYGPQTAAAVIAFQADDGLVADGEVGAATLDALGLD